MKKAIITGATGFIGKALVDELIENNVQILAIIREHSNKIEMLKDLPIKVIECNLENINQLPNLIDDRDIDTVFHMAWQGVSDNDIKDSQIQIRNIQSTLGIIDIMKEMGIRTFVGAGSIHEAESIIDMSEDKIVTNMGYMYKAAKLAAHWMGKAKAGNSGIRFFWPLINTYGEGENSARLINTIIRQIYMNEIPQLSAGNQYYDFVHVKDVAKALYLIAEKGIDGTNYVIGSGDAKPLKDFLTIVGEKANHIKGGKIIPLGFGKLTGNVVCLPKNTFDVTSLVNDTGFKPSIPFDEGIEKTAKWIWETTQKTDCVKLLS